MLVRLYQVIDVKNLQDGWKEIRGNFREDEIKDPILHLDFEADLPRQLSKIQRDVSENRYRVGTFWTLKCGKGKGLFRIHTFLDARDLLVLHAIVRKVERSLLRAAPTRSAYYSRSTRRAPSLTRGMPPGYPWFLWWRAFQKRILRFSTAYKYLVVTDIAGYYDHVQHGFLRDCFQENSNCEKLVSDLLFFVLESLTHRPEYLPNVFSGLPVLNYDAPRLLAHVFLYELDHRLSKHAGTEFTRWMDDINVGVSSKARGKGVLRLICEALRKYYLMPNSAKTRIIPSVDLDREFYFTENTWLTRREARTKAAGRTGRRLSQRRQQLRRRFDAFIQLPATGNWDKVLKRFYTFFGYLRDPYLVPRAFSDLVEMPALASAIIRYFLSLGYMQDTLDGAERYLGSRDNIYEDVEIRLLDFLVDWRVPNSRDTKRRISQIAERMFRRGGARSDAARAVAVALLAKYGRVSDVRRLLDWYYTAQDEDPLLREYVLAFSGFAGPGSVRHRRIVEYASGEPSEAIQRLASFYRNLLVGTTLPVPVINNMTCTQVQVPPFAVFQMRRLAVLHVMAGNPRLRGRVRTLIKRLRKENDDKVIESHLERLSRLR